MEKADGCPLCYLWLKEERELLKRLLTDEVAMNPKFMDEVVAARGFCNRHMYLFYETACRSYAEDGLGYALYMRAVIERIVEQLYPRFKKDTKESAESKFLIQLRKALRKNASFIKAFENAIKGESPCPICKHLWSRDDVHLITLMEMLKDEDFRERFEMSGVLCLPHFLSVIRVIDEDRIENPNDVMRVLLRVEMRHLKSAEQRLSKFIRKHNWEYKDEPIGSEAEANRIALNLLAGVEGLYIQSCRAFTPFKMQERKMSKL